MKNAVYVLPSTPQAREDFEWLRAEVVSVGGQVSIFETSSLAAADERQILARLASSDPPAGRQAPAKKPSSINVREFQHRQWVTRPRPGIDRFGSAWLIRKFIDSGATFVFATAPDKFPDAVPFDMYQPGGFKHEGDNCTFEVLRQRFDIADPIVGKLAEIVHDLDLKDDRYNSPHAPTIRLLVEGLRDSVADDGKLLEQGIMLFEALYQSLRPAKGPRGGKARIC